MMELLNGIEDRVKNSRHRQQRCRTFESSAPSPSDLPIDEVTSEEILAVLQPIGSCQQSPSKNGTNNAKIEKQIRIPDELDFTEECVTTDSAIRDAPLARLDAVRNEEGPQKPLARISDTGDFYIWGQEDDSTLTELFDNDYLHRVGWQEFIINDACGDEFAELARYAGEYNRALADRVDIIKRRRDQQIYKTR